MPRELTSSRTAEIEELFELYAKDSAVVGKVHTDYLGTMLRALDLNPSNSDIKRIVAARYGPPPAAQPTSSSPTGGGDDGGASSSNQPFGGYFGFEDLLELWQDDSIPLGDSDEDLRKAFEVFDTDGSGTISKSELAEALMTMGEAMTKDEVDRMFNRADSNHDGQLDFQEFLALFRITTTTTTAAGKDSAETMAHVAITSTSHPHTTLPGGGQNDASLTRKESPAAQKHSPTPRAEGDPFASDCGNSSAQPTTAILGGGVQNGAVAGTTTTSADPFAPPAKAKEPASTTHPSTPSVDSVTAHSSSIPPPTTLSSPPAPAHAHATKAISSEPMAGSYRMVTGWWTRQPLWEWIDPSEGGSSCLPLVEALCLATLGCGGGMGADDPLWMDATARQHRLESTHSASRSSSSALLPLTSGMLSRFAQLCCLDQPARRIQPQRRVYNIHSAVPRGDDAFPLSSCLSCVPGGPVWISRGRLLHDDSGRNAALALCPAPQKHRHDCLSNPTLYPDDVLCFAAATGNLPQIVNLLHQQEEERNPSEGHHWKPSASTLRDCVACLLTHKHLDVLAALLRRYPTTLLYPEAAAAQNIDFTFGSECGGDSEGSTRREDAAVLLNTAAASGDCRALRMLLAVAQHHRSVGIAEDRFTPFATDCDGSSLAHYAASRLQIDVLQMLSAEYGVNLHCRNGRGQTPLHHAITAGDAAAAATAAATTAAHPPADTQLPTTAQQQHTTAARQELLVDVCRFLLNARPSVPLAAAVGSSSSQRRGSQHSLSSSASGPPAAAAAVPLLTATATAGPSDSFGCDNDGYTALHLAAARGYTATVQVLLSHTTNSPTTPTTPTVALAPLGSVTTTTTTAVPDGSTFSFKPDARTFAEGYTPLHLATLGGHWEVVQLLLRSGRVDPDAVTTTTTTASSTILLSSSPSVSSCKTPLQMAVESGNTKILRLLLETEAVNPNVRLVGGEDSNNKGFAPLHVAAAAGIWEVVDLLTHSVRTNVNATTPDGRTALHVAIEAGATDAAKAMIACKRVQLDAKTDKGWTPLHYAAKTSNNVLATSLLSTGAVDPRAVTNDGLTPLAMAFESDTPQVALALLDVGATSIAPQTVVAGATHRTNTAPAADGADLSALLQLAAGKGLESMVAMLLQRKGMDPNKASSSSDGLTALHCAAKGNGGSTIALLAANTEVNANATTPDGRTALHVAVEAGATAAAKALIACKRVQLDAKTDKGWTPLHYAAKTSNSELAAALLLDTISSATDGMTTMTSTATADVNAATADGRTPAGIAIEVGSADVLSVILRTGRVDVAAPVITYLVSTSTTSSQVPAKPIPWGLLRAAVQQDRADLVDLLLLAVGGKKKKEYDASAVSEVCGGVQGLKQLLRSAALRRDKSIAIGGAVSEQPPTATSAATATTTTPPVAAKEEDHQHQHHHYALLSKLPLLHIVASFGFTSILSLLLRLGKKASGTPSDPELDINAKDAECGRTALHAAAENGRLETFEELLQLEGADPNVQDVDGWSALHVAIAESSGGATIASVLLGDGLRGRVDVCARTSDGWAPLHFAVRQGLLDVVTRLLETGSVAVVDSVDGSGWTPLLIAASEGHEAIALKLLDTDSVDPNVTTPDGWTPLHFAARKKMVALTQRLLMFAKARVDPDARRADQWTPLHVAARNGAADVVSALIAAGADMSAATADGWTALHFAARIGSVPVARALLRAMATATTFATAAPSSTTPRKKVDVNAMNASGCTPLHLACAHASAEVVGLLLTSCPSIDVNIATPSCSGGKLTALHFAARVGSPSIVAELLSSPHEVDTEAETEEGFTALNLAAATIAAGGLPTTTTTTSGSSPGADLRSFEQVVRLLQAHRREGAPPQTVSALYELEP